MLSAGQGCRRRSWSGVADEDDRRCPGRRASRARWRTAARSGMATAPGRCPAANAGDRADIDDHCAGREVPLAPSGTSSAGEDRLCGDQVGAVPVELAEAGRSRRGRSRSPPRSCATNVVLVRGAAAAGWSPSLGRSWRSGRRRAGRSRTTPRRGWATRRRRRAARRAVQRVVLARASRSARSVPSRSVRAADADDQRPAGEHPDRRWCRRAAGTTGARRCARAWPGRAGSSPPRSTSSPSRRPRCANVALPGGRGEDRCARRSRRVDARRTGSRRAGGCRPRTRPAARADVSGPDRAAGRGAGRRRAPARRPGRAGTAVLPKPLVDQRSQCLASPITSSIRPWRRPPAMSYTIPWSFGGDGWVTGPQRRSCSTSSPGSARLWPAGKRLELLDLLAQGERQVEALAAAAGSDLTTASAHLQTLSRPAWSTPAATAPGSSTGSPVRTSAELYARAARGRRSPPARRRRRPRRLPRRAGRLNRSAASELLRRAADRRGDRPRRAAGRGVRRRAHPRRGQHPPRRTRRPARRASRRRRSSPTAAARTACWPTTRSGCCTPAAAGRSGWTTACSSGAWPGCPSPPDLLPSHHRKS